MLIMEHCKFFDIRDLFVFGGLGILGCGLFLRWGLWLACIVCGSFLVLYGLGWLIRIPKWASQKT
jgi:hypothetical protein